MSEKTKDRYYVGVDLGGTNVTAGVLDAKGKIVGREKTKTKADKGEDDVMERIARVVEESINESGLDKSKIGGVGIGAPGAVDVKKGIVINAVNLRWNYFPLAERLSEMVSLPVTLDNDVNVGAWGEYRAGAGKGFDELLAIFVGTGIGGGLVLNGDLHHGFFGTAGEIGHTVVEPNAGRGRRTLENLASRTSIANLLADLIRSNHESALTEITEGKLDKIRSGALSKAMDKKDALTREVIEKAAHYVGIAAANMVTVLSLPCVVLGGGLTEAVGDQFVKWVRDSFDDFVFPPELRECKIVASKLGDDAGVVGAGMLAMDRLG